MKREEGFTLIELLLVISVLGIFGVSVTNVFTSGWQTWQYNQQQLSFKTEERAILNDFQTNLKRAREVTTVDDGATLLVKISTDDDMEVEEWIKYGVENNILKLWTVTDETKVTGDWPDDWGTGIDLTQEIIVDTQYDYNEDKNIVQIKVDLTKDGDFTESDYEIQKEIFLRLLA